MAITINQVILVGGNLTKDAELQHTQAGKPFLSFSVAMNKSRRGQDGQWENDADFFNVTLWGEDSNSPAVTLAPRLTKGQKVAIEGKLTQDRYTDKTGAARSTVKIIASKVVMMESKRTENAESQQYQPPAQYQQAPYTHAPYPPPQAEERQPNFNYAELDENDVPF